MMIRSDKETYPLLPPGMLVCEPGKHEWKTGPVPGGELIVTCCEVCQLSKEYDWRPPAGRGVWRNIAQGKGQAEAQSRCGYGPITVRREGGNLVVEVEYKGEAHEVIRESLDSNFCHTVEPLGILGVLEEGKRVAA
jgi:hypothetical protein